MSQGASKGARKTKDSNPPVHTFRRRHRWHMRFWNSLTRRTPLSPRTVLILAVVSFLALAAGILVVQLSAR